MIEIWVYHKQKHTVINVNFFPINKKKQQYWMCAFNSWMITSCLIRKRNKKSFAHPVSQTRMLLVIIIIIIIIIISCIITNKWLIWTAPAIYLPPPMINTDSARDQLKLVMRQYHDTDQDYFWMLVKKSKISAHGYINSFDE